MGQNPLIRWAVLSPFEGIMSHGIIQIPSTYFRDLQVVCSCLKTQMKLSQKTDDYESDCLDFAIQAT